MFYPHLALFLHFLILGVRTMKKFIGGRLIESILKGDMTTPNDYDIRDDRLTGFLVRVYKSGRASYVVEYDRGKRHTICNVAKLKPAQARDKAKEILGDYTKGIDPRQKEAKKKSATLEKFLDEVFGPDYIPTHKHGELTIKRIKSRFPKLLKKPIHAITVSELKKWKARRLDQDKVTISTVNRDLDVLRLAIRSAWKEYKLLDHDPMAELKRDKVDNSRVRYLSEDEEKRLLAALNFRQERHREGRDNHNEWRKERNLPPLPSLRDSAFTDHIMPLVLLAMHTGARRGEMFSLEWSDIDLELAFMTIRAATAKSGKTRHIPLNSIAMETLISWKRQTNGSRLVFPGKKGKRLDNIHTAWEKLLALAEIENFRFHDLRHHFASKLVMAGVDLNTVRELLGHADLKMTLRYAHLAPKMKAEAVARLAAPQAPRGQVIPLTNYQN